MADGGARTRTDRGPIVALVLGALLPALLAAGPVYDSDGWWHLRTGDLILRSRSIPRRDPFSWTAHGAPWQPNSWGADVFLESLHRAGGLVALSLFKSAAIIALAFAAYGLARQTGARAWPAAVTGLATVGAVFLFVVERPQTLSYLLFALSLGLARRALHAARGRLLADLAGLAAVLVVWANVHAAVLTGAALLGALAVGTAVETRRLRPAAGLAAVASGAVLCTPFGWSLITHATAVRRASQGIREWQHFAPLGWPDRPITWFVVLAAFALMRSGRWRRPTVFVPLAVAVALTTDALRNGPFLVLLAGPELALGLSTLRLPVIERPRLFAGVALVGWAVGAAVLVPFALTSAGEPRRSTFPVETAPLLPSGCHVLNEYEQGGYLLWKRPDIRVSRDGRNDVYGRARLAEQERVLDARPSPAAARRWLDVRHVDCVVAYPRRRLVATLREAPGWRVRHEEQSAVLLIRGRK